MNPVQIACIIRSFQHLLLIEETFAALFYVRLFTLEPSLRPMFGADMQAEGRKLTAMLHRIMKHLGQTDTLLRELRESEQRHANSGIRAEHYAPISAALLWALEQALNERYTPDVEQAWTSLLLLITTMMQPDTTPTTCYPQPEG